MGGGNAGDVNYPTHMLETHKRWLYGDDELTVNDTVFNVDKAMRDAWTAGSPYASVSAYGGIDADLDKAQSRIDAFVGMIERLYPDESVDGILMRALMHMDGNDAFQYTDPTTPTIDAGGAIDTALAKMTEDPFADQTIDGITVGDVSDPSVSDPAEITPDTLTATDVAAPGDVTADLLVTQAVDAFEARQKAAHKRAVANIAAGFFEARQVTGSQFGVALALLEAERQSAYNDYDEKLRVEQVRLNHQAAVSKRDLTTQAALREAELALQADTKEAELKVQVALRRAEMIIDKDIRIASLIQEEDREKRQLEANADQRQIDLQLQWDTQRSQHALGLVGNVMQAETGQADIAQRIAGIRANLEDSRAKAAISLASSMYSSYDALTKNLLLGHQATSGLQGDLSKTRIQLKQEELQFDLEMEVRDALWDLEIFQYGQGVMSSIAGAATVNSKTSFDKVMQVAGFGVSMFTGIAGLALPLIMMLSDRRMKCDLRAIGRPLDTLLSLKGQRYRYRPDLNLGNDDRMGFMAQDVSHVLPEWVGRTNDGDMYLKFQPFEFEALAVEAIRELEARVTALEWRAA